MRTPRPADVTFRRWRNLILVAIVAALCFGGSFTCSCSSDGNDDDDLSGGSGSVNL